MFSKSFLSAILITALPVAALAAPILYGGNGGHPSPAAGVPGSINNGALITIDQTNGAPTLIGTPAGVERLTGIAFDASGNFWGSTITGGGFPPPSTILLTSTLIQINPATGALIHNVGPITANAANLGIADITIQPSTGLLFGIENPDDSLHQPGNLYTINPLTGVATLVGSTGKFFNTIAFAPNGTLYLEAADLSNGPVNPTLYTIDPATGHILTSEATNDFFGALAVRPTDGVIFGSTGDSAQIFTINPSTGAETLVGSTGQNFVGGLAFAQVPEPGAFALLALGLITAGVLAKRR